MTEKLNRKEKLLALTQAALLHDIGKLLQRAEPETDIKEKYENVEPHVCPNWKNKGYSHPHVLWTLHFFEKIVNDNNLILAFSRDLKIGEHTLDTVSNIAIKHHSPDEESSWQKVVQIADWCSSGMDREKCDDYNEEKVRTFDYTTQRLLSPWSSIEIHQQRAQHSFYPLRPLSPKSKTVFPEIGDAKSVSQTDNYKKLRDNLYERLQAIGKHFDVKTQQELILDALLSALEHTTWCVPSSTHDLPNISLYDHSKTTAAIAVCLADFYMDNNDNLEFQFIKSDQQVVINNDAETKPFRFLVIDLAGIQDYIYDMNKSGFKGMAKVLRGRSFFVNAILEGIEIALLETLELPRILRLMDAGGKLIFLLPNRKDIEEKIKVFRENLEAGLLKDTHGKLRVLFGLGEPFGVNAFLDNSEEKDYPLNTAYKSAFKALEKAKLRPYSTQVGKIENQKLDQVYFDDKGACEACGKLPAKKHWKDESDYYCENCYAQREIGKDLIEGRFIIYRKVKKSNDLSNRCILPGLVLKERNENGGPDIEYALILEVLKSVTTDKLKLSSGVSILWNDEKDDEPAKGHRIVYKANYARRFMSDDEINQLHINQKEEKPSIVDILTFEHLAELAKQQGAARYIAAVSGDVDNMGHLFEHLMEREKAPLTMAVTISRQFDFFFSGILDAHLRNGDKRIYTVYAGGDDLFYIGAWNEILDEVYEWRKLFGAYVANHPKITFSAGVSLHHPNLPINRIRHDAEGQLHQAKNANKEDPTDKNRICIWNTPLKWSDKEKDEWNNEVIMYVNLLNEAINKKALNSSMMYRLLSYTRSAKKVHSKSKKMRIDDCIWNSLLRYDIARNWKDKNNNKQFKNGLEKIGKEVEQFYGVGTVDPVKYDLFGNKFPIAMMWALYLVRHKESKPKNKGE